MRLTIYNPRLFYRKVATLTVATIILVPLVHYKLYISAFVYLGGLLILHLYIFYVYCKGVPLRELAANKKELVARVGGIGFFIYLLTVVSFAGSLVSVMINLVAAFMVHIGILLLMMGKLEKKSPIAPDL